MTDHFRWNISLNTRSRFEADAYVVSIPKSGRTWLGVLVQAYFCAWDGRDFDLRLVKFSNPSIPHVLFTHDRFEHSQERRWWGRLRGRNLIPPRMAASRPILLLVRDPRDVVVSLYFQLNRREKTGKRFDGTVSQLIRDPRRGIDRMIAVMNSWLQEWSGRSDFLLVRYEDLRRDAAIEGRRVMQFLGVAQVDDVLLERAIEFSSFDNMKAMERTGAFKASRLQAADAKDPDSFKVRKGKIGAYRETLAAEDLVYLDSAMTKLDPRFGYGAVAPFKG